VDYLGAARESMLAELATHRGKGMPRAPGESGVPNLVARWRTIVALVSSTTTYQRFRLCAAGYAEAVPTLRPTTVSPSA
jgi:hypothetical protein